MDNFFSALILMGGEGRRLGSSLPKQFHALGSLKVYQHTLERLRKSQLFQEIILVCHPDWMARVQTETAHLPEVKVVEGGETRQASSSEGLKACHPRCGYVMIHDAVRPFVSPKILQSSVEAVLKYHAIDTVIPSADTLITTTDGNTIDSIPPRNYFRRGQTPQTFAYPLICLAHRKASVTDATDDCRLVMDLGVPIHLLDGSEENLKITTKRDLWIAELVLRCQNNVECQQT
jgi:ribitol-5-phosphate 2-dehydrogenase (NADP+) / D-ribitol-5-phosphate cytidylyltransferase